WQALSYSEYVGLEAAAASISDFGLGYIPGLLQTLDYARAVAHGAVPRWSPDIVEQSVDARILRQQLLYSERAPRFETAMDESVLHRVVGSPDTMATQLERLVELSQLPHVSIRVIPYSAGALPAGNNKFIILRFAQPTVSDVVFIEGLTEDQYLDDSHDIEVYNVTFRTLRAMAWSDDETRDKMSAMIANYRSAG
ncbi:MAG TPA: DUF5753 domain-containing protein, partial [Streptosporangiaceae bacterium]|nr:DUF5753 domain-containing protein [Streptosporangiaceae bacterium]